MNQELPPWTSMATPIDLELAGKSQTSLLTSWAEDLSDFEPDILEALSSVKHSSASIQTGKQESENGEKPIRIEEDNGKRKREARNMREKRRRERVRESMRTLGELIPNCHKNTRDNPLLDLAIEYIKFLQNQIESDNDVPQSNEHHNPFPRSIW